VASLAVWKMHQRWPDMAFPGRGVPEAREVARLVAHTPATATRTACSNGEPDGTGLAGANFETGWDDNVEYDGASMVGDNMNVDAVDLNSLWAMDAEYLANIATSSRQDE